MSQLILPGNPLFNISLATLPPGWQNSASNSPKFIVRSNGAGLLEQVDDRQFQDYVHGGEFDQRLNELDDDEDVIYFDL